MKISKEKFNSSLKNFQQKSLSDEQKNIMLSNIYESTGANFETKPNATIVSPFGQYVFLFKKRAFVALAVLVLIMTGTTYASAQSLPGDLLYGFKTKVIEPTITALKISEESKNEYKVYLIQKRIDELKELSKNNDLDRETKEESSEITNTNVQNLNDKTENRTEIEVKVKEYNNIISPKVKIEVDTEIDVDKNATDRILDETKEKVDEIEDVVKEAKDEIDSKVDKTIDEIKDEVKVPEVELEGENKTNINIL